MHVLRKRPIGSSFSLFRTEKEVSSYRLHRFRILVKGTDEAVDGRLNTMATVVRPVL